MLTTTICMHMEMKYMLKVLGYKKSSVEKLSIVTELSIKYKTEQINFTGNQIYTKMLIVKSLI